MRPRRPLLRLKRPGGGGGGGAVLRFFGRWKDQNVERGELRRFRIHYYA